MIHVIFVINCIKVYNTFQVVVFAIWPDVAYDKLFFHIADSSAVPESYIFS